MARLMMPQITAPVPNLARSDQMLRGWIQPAPRDAPRRLNSREEANAVRAPASTAPHEMRLRPMPQLAGTYCTEPGRLVIIALLSKVVAVVSPLMLRSPEERAAGASCHCVSTWYSMRRLRNRPSRRSLLAIG